MNVAGNGELVLGALIGNEWARVDGKHEGNVGAVVVIGFRHGQANKTKDTIAQ